MYLTLHPDVDCAHLIVQSGIKEVWYDEMLSSKRIKDLKQLSSSPTDSKELKTFRDACDILRLGRVSLRYVKNFTVGGGWETMAGNCSCSLRKIGV